MAIPGHRPGTFSGGIHGRTSGSRAGGKMSPLRFVCGSILPFGDCLM